jgi:transposase
MGDPMKGKLYIELSFSVECIECDAVKKGVVGFRENIKKSLTLTGWYNKKLKGDTREIWYCPACKATYFSQLNQREAEVEAFARRVAQLRETDQKSWEDIAKELGISYNQALSRYNKSIKLRLARDEETLAAMNTKNEAAVRANLLAAASKRTIPRDTINEFVRLVTEEKLSVRDASLRVGISPSTGQNLQQRYISKGKEK